MAHFKASLAGALALAVLSAGAAGATVVTFDDLSGSGTVADGYGGIIWDGNYSYYDGEQAPYTPASPPERAYGTCDCLNDNNFYFASPVTFDGAYFSGLDTTTTSFKLYLGGMLVGASADLNLSSTPTFLASGYSGLVDQVDVYTNNPGYWVIDDITYNGGVPEPAAWVMMLTGFGLLGAAARRRSAVA